MKKHFDRIRFYRDVYLWLAGVCLKEMRLGQLILVVVLNLAGTAMMGCIIGLTALFVTFVQSGSLTIPYLGISIDDTSVAVIAISVIVLLLLFFAAYFLYTSSVIMRRSARKAHVVLTDYSLKVIRDLPRYQLTQIAEDKQRLLKFLTRDTRQASLAFESMLRCIRPILFIVVALLIALYLEPFLTVILLPFLVILAPIVYSLGMKIMRNSREHYETNIYRKSKHLVGTILDMGVLPSIGNIETINTQKVINSDDFVNYLDSYDSNRLAGDRMSFALSLIKSLLIATGILIFGWLAMEGSREWDNLVAFIGGLILLTNGVQSLLVQLTILHRFYPQIQVLYKLLTIKHEAIDIKKVPDSITMTIEGQIDGSDNEISIHKHDVTLLVKSSPMAQDLLLDILIAFKYASDSSQRIWHGVKYVSSYVDVTVNDINEFVLGTDPDKTMKQWFASICNIEELQQDVVTDESDQTAPRFKPWDEISPLSKAIITICTIAAEKPPVLLMDISLLKQMSADSVDHFINKLEIPYLFIVADKRAIGMGLNYDQVLVIKGSQIIGAGDDNWLDLHKDAILATLFEGRDVYDINQEDMELY